MTAEYVSSQEQDRLHKSRFEEWIPEIQQQFRDRMLDVLGDRFKIEFIAKYAQEKHGAMDAKDVIAFMSEVAIDASRRYPKHHFLDGIYKALQG